LNEREKLQDQGIDKITFTKRKLMRGGPAALDWRQGVGCCEHGDELALATKSGEFLE
jgi:hypothetical protein